MMSQFSSQLGQQRTWRTLGNRAKMTQSDVGGAQLLLRKMSAEPRSMGRFSLL